MKKIYLLFLTLIMAVSFIGCQRTDSTEDTDKNAGGVKEAEEKNNSAENTADNSTASGGKSLVVYFSVPETTDPENMTEEEENSAVVIDGEVLGNTQYVAYVIQENTGADIFRIEPEIPYTTEHEELVDLAREEQSEDARPAIKEEIENIDEYTDIYVGYPIWWSDMPQILYTFFDTYDFSGKNIIPFSTHGGSQLAGTVETIKELEPDARVYEDALTISRDDVQDAEDEIISWLDNLKE